MLRTHGKHMEPSNKSSAAAGRRILMGAFALLHLLVIVGLVLLALDRPRIAFVRSGTILEEYAGIQEARRIIERQSQSRQANLDTLRLDYESMRKEFDRQHSDLDQGELRAHQSLLRRKEEQLQQYHQAIARQSREAEEEVTRNVLARINTNIQRFGREQGYDIILGTLSAGNLLFGEDALDITDQVLDHLNTLYRPGQHEKLH